MIGIKIALSGVVVFAFSSFMFGIARKPPENKILGAIMGLLCLASFSAIPIGLLMAIWL